MKIYKAKIEKNSMLGLSLVSNAANKRKVVYLSETGKDVKVTVKLQDEEKRRIISPILIPNMPIYRQSEDGGYYIVFSRQDVELACRDLFQSETSNNFNIEHNEKTHDIFMAESWIVDNPEMDKSKLYGYDDLPVGTWMGVFDLNSDELIQLVKEGKLDGISPEIIVGLEEIKLEEEYSLDYIKGEMKKIIRKKLENIQ